MQRRMGHTHAPIPNLDQGPECPCPTARSDRAMTREQLNRELRAHSANFPAVLIVYAAIVGTMVLTGIAMT